jgi:hypothetical protein
LYSQSKLKWQGEALSQAFQQNEKRVVDSKEIEDGLPPLFKI